MNRWIRNSLFAGGVVAVVGAAYVFARPKDQTQSLTAPPAGAAGDGPVKDPPPGFDRAKRRGALVREARELQHQLDLVNGRLASVAATLFQIRKEMDLIHGALDAPNHSQGFVQCLVNQEWKHAPDGTEVQAGGLKNLCSRLQTQLDIVHEAAREQGELQRDLELKLRELEKIK